MSIENKIMEYIIDNKLPPMFDHEIARAFDIDKKDSVEFQKILTKLVEEGKLFYSRKKKYGLPEFFGVVVGRLEIAKKGFGFVITDNPEESDIFIPRSNLNGGMHDDIVSVKILNESDNGKKKEGEIVGIIKKGNSQIVGVFQKANGFGFIVPDDKRINWDLFVPGNLTKNCQDGYKVIADVIKWPIDDKNPEGKIIEILGPSNDPFVEEEAIIRAAGVRQGFSKKIINKANELKKMK